MKTTDEAREYFKPLTYDDLTEKNFNRLVAILTEVLGKWNRQVLEDREEHGHDNKYYMEIHPHKRFGRYPGTRFIDKKDKEAFIMVKCDNYSVRTGISFNKDGYIGFAGWADSDNVKPFINAFKEWVDKIKLEKYDKALKTHIEPEDLYKIHSVVEFPTNPTKGMIVYKDNVEYVYTGEWCSLESTDKLTQIKQLFDKWEE